MIKRKGRWVEVLKVAAGTEVCDAMPLSVIEWTAKATKRTLYALAKGGYGSRWLA